MIDLTWSAGTDEADSSDRGPLGRTASSPDELLDPGPPTAPVTAVDLGLDLTGPDRAAAPPRTDAPSGSPRLDAGASGADADPDDEFLAELRKAMADEEPLGPRQEAVGVADPGSLDEERRPWRFGKRK